MSGPAKLGALLLLALLAACAFWKGDGARKDAFEAQREASVEERRNRDEGTPPGAPLVEFGPEGFGESRLARAGSTVAEGLVLVALAALVTGTVSLYKRRLPLLGLIASALALIVALLAFLKSWA